MSRRKVLIFVIVVTATLLIDQLAKRWIIANFQLYESQTLIDPVLYLTHTSNTGIAFGIGEGNSGIFLIVIMGVILAMLWFYWHSTTRLQQIAFAMVVGGALGNVIDRLRFGHVVDFVHIVIPDLISNVSNFADHFIVIGVILLIIDSFLQERAAKNNEEEIVTQSTAVD